MTLKKEIINRRDEHIKKYGYVPRVVYLTKQELYTLNIEEREYIVSERERDLKVRLCPELLPPMRSHINVTYGCSIYGMEIKETISKKPNNIGRTQTEFYFKGGVLTGVYW